MDDNSLPTCSCSELCCRKQLDRGFLEWRPFEPLLVNLASQAEMIV